MPVWMPGYYQLMNYAGAVEHFHAFDDKGRELDWKKTDASTWQVSNKDAGTVTLSYDVKAATQFVANPFLDDTHAYIAPAGLFLYIEGLIDHPVTVKLKPAPKWDRIATGLDPVTGREHTFYAQDFDILYDSPILIGHLEELPGFTIKGIPHRFIGFQLGSFDRQRFMDDLKKLVTKSIAVIGDIPYKHYTFLAIGPGRGGIEHLNSCTLSFEDKELSTPAGWRNMMSFITHEYFHHYNVKRIRPVELGPFDYSKEARTDLLWISEGLTVYYEHLLMKRAGLFTKEELLQAFQSDIAAFENKKGRLFQSLAQASYETWSDGPFGRTGAGADSTISYYEKGPIVGLLLDLAIRNSTRDQRSLDDVMRLLYTTYYQQKKRGFSGAEFQQACETVAGRSLTGIFEYVYTVKPLDYPLTPPAGSWPDSPAPHGWSDN